MQKQDVLGHRCIPDVSNRNMWSDTIRDAVLTTSDRKSELTDIAVESIMPGTYLPVSEVSAQKHHTQLADGMDDSHCPVPYRRIFPELCRGNDNCGIIFADKIHIKI